MSLFIEKDWIFPSNILLAEFTSKDGYTIRIVKGVMKSEKYGDRKGTIYYTAPRNLTVKGGFFMGWWEPEFEEWYGVSKSEYRKLSLSEKAKLEVLIQDRKWSIKKDFNFHKKSGELRRVIWHS